MPSGSARPSALQGGTRRRRGLVRLAGLTMVFVLGLAALLVGGGAGRHVTARDVSARSTIGGASGHAGSAHGYATAPAPPGRLVAARFNKPPRGGLLFDLDSGRVLWSRRPLQQRSIASLTKMMTALLVVEREPASAQPLVTREALRYQGSGVGLLPRGKRVGVVPLLYGLLLPSGNDAARVLAQDVGGGSIARFVELMNERARQLGLTCTRFAGPDGYDDANRSCPRDLALLAHAVMREPLLRRIVGTPYISFRFPIKRHKLYLEGHNPLWESYYPGWTGIKTGYSPTAGLCFVGTARRGRTQLGVVLLDSPNPGAQAAKLLDRGFVAARRPVFPTR